MTIAIIYLRRLNSPEALANPPNLHLNSPATFAAL